MKRFFLLVFLLNPLVVWPDGILSRMETSVDALLTSTGPGSSKEINKLVTYYAPYATQSAEDIKNKMATQESNFTTRLIRDAGYLLEGLFAHCGMLMGVSVCAGIDMTEEDFLDQSLFFSRGVVKPLQTNVLNGSEAPTPALLNAPPPTTDFAASDGMTVPQLCASLFHASRYMRVLGQTFMTIGQASSTTIPVDWCVGVAIMNGGKIYSITPPANGNFKAQKENNYFWLPAGVSVQSVEGKVLGFVNYHSLGYAPFSGGVDQWDSYNGARTLKLVVANDVGSTAFSAVQLGNGARSITLQLNSNGSINVNDAQGNTMSYMSVTAEVKKFYASLSGPWVIILEMYNHKPESGDMFPTFAIKGLMKVNYFDYPLQYEAPQSEKIGSQFSLLGLAYAPSSLLQELQSITRYTKSMLENSTTYGSCNSYVVNVSLPIFAKNGLSVNPINAGLAKMYGALEYDWGTKKYTIEQALRGIENIMSALFFKKSSMTVSYFEHKLKHDSNVLLL